MSAFSYAALDESGTEQSGIIEADTSRQVRQILRDQGLSPLQVVNTGAMITPKNFDDQKKLLSFSRSPS